MKRPPSYHAMAAIKSGATQHLCLSLYQAVFEPPIRGLLVMFDFDAAGAAVDCRKMTALLFQPKPCVHLPRVTLYQRWPSGETIEHCPGCGMYRLVHEQGRSGWAPLELEQAMSGAAAWLDTVGIVNGSTCVLCYHGNRKHLIGVGGRWVCPVPRCAVTFEYGAEPWDR